VRDGDDADHRDDQDQNPAQNLGPPHRALASSALQLLAESALPEVDRIGHRVGACRRAIAHAGENSIRLANGLRYRPDSTRVRRSDAGPYSAS
jgi:hypothetical protein